MTERASLSVENLPLSLCLFCRLDPALCPHCGRSVAAPEGDFEEYPDILTVEEAAEALRVGYNALYELLNEGKVKAYKNGRVWRIPKESIKAYILESANLSKQ